MKCAICNEKIEMNFLNKIMGTYIRKKAVCSICQKKFPTDGELKGKLK
ncbi:hypothetical protein HYU13_02420 [Candidatus Woesearchaeota archaeon]|nr:hypothetical protein [Candidatus Woesearchaeota archaeon]